MFNWLKKSNNSSNGATDESAVIRVIGDRSSGKTTYMASMAYWPNADSASPVQQITAINDEANELITKAQNILEQGLQLEQTDLDGSAIDVKDYTLSITLRDQFSWQKGAGTLKLNISCKDYSGEFFRDLLYKAGDPQLEEYLEDCLEATGILFLVDGTTHRKDGEYANGLDKFLMSLDRTDFEGKQRRIALVMTKCEQSELWINRHKPRELAQSRFPQLYRKLESWAQTGQVDYFTTSAFGMLGNQFPEPNSKKLRRDRDGTASVIKNPKRWRPFGLVAPVYWLCTGQRHKDLEKD